MADNEYLAEYAKQGRAKCKHSGCKTNIEKDTARLGKSHPSGFHDGNQVDWYHPKCLFKAFCNAKKGSKLVEDVDDIKGFLMLKKEDKDDIKKHFNDFQSGKLKKEVLEEKKKKREDNKKEKEMLEKMLGKSGVGSPKKGAATKKNVSPKKTSNKNGTKNGPKFIEGLIDSNEDDEEPSNDSVDIQPSKKNIETSPVKKVQTKPQPTSNSPKKPSNVPEEKLFGVWCSSFSPLTSNLPGFNHFSQTHKESLNLFSIKQTPRVLCIGLSPYHHPLIKYDKATAYNNLLQSISPQSNFSVFKWFTALKERQQFLFLHSPTGEPTFDCYWVPLLLKTIKIILKSVQQENQGIVIALFGTEAQKISPIILHLFKNNFQDANFRLLQFQDLSKPVASNNSEKLEDNNNNLSIMNFDKVISAAASEIGLPSIRWYTKKEYVMVVKGNIDGNPINHLITQNANLGRVSFEHQLSDKRISRDQVKVELIEGEESTLRITVLGRNPIEVQHEREERKVLSQGESDVLKSGEKFNLILNGQFFQLALTEIAEDGSLIDDKSKGIKKESPTDSNKSFSRSVSNMETQSYTQSYSPTLQRSNSSDLKIKQSPISKDQKQSDSPQNKRKRPNETELGRETRKKGKTVNYKEIGSDDDLEAEEDIDEDEDEALARQLQKEFEKENETYQKKKNGKQRGSDKRKLRNRKTIVMEDSSEEDRKRIKAEIEDGGPDSPYEEDDLWAQDKKHKYKSEEEEISSSDDDDDEDDEDDDLDIPKKKIPCKFGAGCYRKNPDHLREFSHPK
jgi:hypothetical protein